MTVPIPPIGDLAPVTATPDIAGTSGTDLGSNLATMFGNGLDALQSAQSSASTLAVQAATGNLTDISQYTVAATKAQVMTEFASALRTKAIDAFNTIMGMQA